MMSVIPLVLVFACGSGEEAVQVAQPVAQVVDGALLSKTWPARLANDQERAEFENDPGWKAVFNNDLAAALSAFAASGNSLGMARIHLGMSQMYRQGALLAANATHHVYGEDAQDTDPRDLAYVVGVSRAIRGDVEAAKKSLNEVSGDSAAAGDAERWRKWLDSGEEWPPSKDWLDTFVPTLGEVKVGEQPGAVSLPSFQFEERSEQQRLLDVNDPTVLLALSEWHAAASHEAGGEGMDSLLAQMRGPTSLSLDSPANATQVAADTGWLFGSAYMMSADLAFLADAQARGAAAVESWVGESVLAAALAPTIVDGKVDPERVFDRAMGVSHQLRRMMADISGSEAGFHRPFAKRAQQGVIQAGMIVADATDQYRDAGILRLGALEKMDGPGMDPVFAMSAAAWDAGNKNPLRPEDILHVFIPSYPALAAARTPLEALHLRRSRSAVPTSPVH